MPNLEKHEESCMKRYGNPFTELHQWMDEPSAIMGNVHRKFRHDVNVTPKEAIQLFGPQADNACIDHIILDYEESAKSKKAKNSNMLTCRGTEELLKAIEGYTVFVGTTKSKLIKEAISEFLSQNAPYVLFKRFQEHIASRNPFEAKQCEKCGAFGKIALYHVDRNIENNSNDNLVVICENCIAKLDRFRKEWKLKESFFEWFFS
jgi:hypothetical protein